MITEAIIASVIAGSSVCSDHFENTSRFNPTTLSDYQQCVYTVHEKDSGIIGDRLWVRTGNDFTYVPVKQIQSVSRDTGMKIIEDAVLRTVFEGIIEELGEEFEAELAELQDMLDVANANVAAKQLVIDGLNARITQLNSNHAEAIANLNSAHTTAISNLESQHASAVSALEMARDGFLAERNTARSERDSLQRQLNAINGRIDAFDIPEGGRRVVEVINYKGADPFLRVTLYGADGVEISRAGIMANYNEYLNTAPDAPDAGDYTTGVTGTSSTSFEVGEVVDSFTAEVGDVVRVINGRSTSYVRWDGTAWVGDSSVNAVYTADVTSLGLHPATLNANLNGATVNRVTASSVYTDVEISGENFNTLSAALFEAIEDAVQEAYDAGYAAGYERGYQDGYDAGYADGFADGVAYADGN